MKQTSLFAWWNRCFFGPVGPLPICVFRILYGILIIANLLTLHSDWLLWFGSKGLLPCGSLVHFTGCSFGVFRLLKSDGAIITFYWALLIAAGLLTVGLFSRWSCILVFIGLYSIQLRNPYILSGADDLLRVVGFWLMFAPIHADLSIDRTLNFRRGKGDSASRLYAPWSIRMIQLQLCLLYFASFWWKLLGNTWRDGSALYYILRLDEFKRFPLPSMSLLAYRLGTWSTLTIEAGFGILVWVPRLRRYALLAGVLLHLGIEYSMNMLLFEWSVIAIYVTFLSEDQITWALRFYKLCSTRHTKEST